MLAKSLNSKKPAFTIIEVVLVLAVAGLIFLVVFAAIPRLQASRRDNQRKRDLDALYSLILDFESNVGRHPTTTELRNAYNVTDDSPFDDYLGSNLKVDPSGGNYVHVVAADFADSEEGTLLYIGANYQCSANGTTYQGFSGNENWMLAAMLERGVYCLDSETV